MGRAIGSFGCGVLVFALAGCSDPTELDGARDALHRWEDEGPHSYVYVVNGYGIEEGSQFINTGFTDSWDLAGSFRLVVEGGKVTTANSTAHGAYVAEPVEDMTALMKRIVFYMTDAGYRPENYEATFDERWGYVRTFHAGDDDSTDIKVECLEEGTTREQCPLATVPLEQCLSEPIPTPTLNRYEVSDEYSACPLDQWRSPVADSDLVCCRAKY